MQLAPRRDRVDGTMPTWTGSAADRPDREADRKHPATGAAFPPMPPAIEVLLMLPPRSAEVHAVDDAAVRTLEVEAVHARKEPTTLRLRRSIARSGVWLI
jgi:hypothetical protein